MVRTMAKVKPNKIKDATCFGTYHGIHEISHFHTFTKTPFMIKANKEVNTYIDALPDDRKNIITKLVKLVRKNMPTDFEEGMSGGMISYHVPHRLYPAGYHCKPSTPLPFFWIAASKNITLYHMGIYASPDLLKWFTAAYAKATTVKLDMGKSCIRFKKPEHLPVELVGELLQRMTAEEWIALYEKNYVKKK